MKNMMAMVGAIATQTFRTAATKEEARTSSMDKLRMLSHAHDILTRSSWTGALMPDVIEGALAPYRTGRGRIHVEGPAVQLGPEPALSLALALHGLATNATKYGALSVPEGTIHVEWAYVETSDVPSLQFQWRESGGPVVVPPTRHGFGSRLIESSLATDFGNTVKVEYLPTGLVCRYVTTLHKVGVAWNRGGDVMDTTQSERPNAVLVVEDEALLRLHAVGLHGGRTEIRRNRGRGRVTKQSPSSRRDLDIAVVFTDVRMPGSMDGLKLAKAVRDRWPPIPIVVVSGHLSSRKTNCRRTASSSESRTTPTK